MLTFTIKFLQGNIVTNQFGLDYRWYLDMCHGLGVVVEGGHSELKDMLREQHFETDTNAASIDFVSILTQGLDRMSAELIHQPDMVRRQLVLVAGQFYTLSELCQGNMSNQNSCYDGNVLKHINTTLEAKLHVFDFNDENLADFEEGQEK